MSLCYEKFQSRESCPKCATKMFEWVCPDKSCTACLGLHGGYVCEGCGWSGDQFDVMDAINAICSELAEITQTNKEQSEDG